MRADLQFFCERRIRYQASPQTLKATKFTGDYAALYSDANRDAHTDPSTLSSRSFARIIGAAPPNNHGYAYNGRCAGKGSSRAFGMTRRGSANSVNQADI